MKLFVLLCVLAFAPAALSEHVSANGGDLRVEGSQDLPELSAPVNDFAGVIDGASKNQIDELIRKLQGATGDVMVVTTIKTFQPEGDLKSYAVKMFENHGKGIGIKGKDNGVLIVLALDDRQVWIESGYGLEGFLTDGFNGETSRSMTPLNASPRDATSISTLPRCRSRKRAGVAAAAGSRSVSGSSC